MKFAFYTISYSPHQVPLAKALMEALGESDYRYVSAQPVREERKRMGWGDDIDAKWYLKEWENKGEARKVLALADVLMCGLRDLPLMENRCKKGLKTIYCSERWFKPWKGMFRLLNPSYFKMAWRFVRLLRSNEVMYYFPMGIHAARDMARLCGLFSGDLRCLFRPPKLDFERKPGGQILSGHKPLNVRRYCLDKMRIWGYFVEPSKFAARENLEAGGDNPRVIRVLWVGRLLKLKRVDTLVRAVCEHTKLKRKDPSLPTITLDIYGTGSEEAAIKRMARGCEDIIKFYPPVPIAEVRKLMHKHDLYVLASNAYEGWGAVVSEALEEGMNVIGSYEAGSSATLLPDLNLFQSGDWRRLRSLMARIDAGNKASTFVWTARFAAEYIIHFSDK